MCILRQLELLVEMCYYADSTMLAYVLSELNKRRRYHLDVFLLSIDEGITGYRDDSLETVKRNEIQVSIHQMHIVGLLVNSLKMWKG
ncbi:hypothetical protein ZWY2020_022670 [Hordeum vulgare]|nr:hypothetical protein ZWY2020_022670 [Hordeum vulgare]